MTTAFVVPRSSSPARRRVPGLSRSRVDGIQPASQRGQRVRRRRYARWGPRAGGVRRKRRGAARRRARDGIPRSVPRDVLLVVFAAARIAIGWFPIHLIGASRRPGPVRYTSRWRSPNCVGVRRRDRAEEAGARTAALGWAMAVCAVGTMLGVRQSTLPVRGLIERGFYVAMLRGSSSSRRGWSNACVRRRSRVWPVSDAAALIVFAVVGLLCTTARSWWPARARCAAAARRLVRRGARLSALHAAVVTRLLVTWLCGVTAGVLLRGSCSAER